MKNGFCFWNSLANTHSDIKANIHVIQMQLCNKRTLIATYGGAPGLQNMQIWKVINIQDFQFLQMYVGLQPEDQSVVNLQQYAGLTFV